MARGRARGKAKAGAAKAEAPEATAGPEVPASDQDPSATAASSLNTADASSPAAQEPEAAGAEVLPVPDGFSSTDAPRNIEASSSTEAPPVTEASSSIEAPLATAASSAIEASPAEEAPSLTEAPPVTMDGEVASAPASHDDVVAAHEVSAEGGEEASLAAAGAHSDNNCPQLTAGVEAQSPVPAAAIVESECDAGAADIDPDDKAVEATRPLAPEAEMGEVAHGSNDGNEGLADLPEAVGSEKPAAGEPLKQGSLEDTIMDPLAGVERDALTRIRQHESEVGEVQEMMNKLRESPDVTSEVELRRVVGVADKVESMLGVPREVLARETMAHEWPAAQLAYARGVVAAIDLFEAATASASTRLGENASPEDATTLGRAPGALCESLEELLNSWTELRDKETNKRPDIVRTLHLNNTMRARSLRLLCDALLDKSIEVYQALPRRASMGAVDLDMTLPANGPPDSTGFARRLQNLLRQPRIYQALEQLSVEVPDHDLFQANTQAPPLGTECALETSAAALPSAAVGGPLQALQETSTAPSSPLAPQSADGDAAGLPEESAAPADAAVTAPLETAAGSAAPEPDAKPSGGRLARAGFAPASSERTRAKLPTPRIAQRRRRPAPAPSAAAAAEKLDSAASGDDDDPLNDTVEVRRPGIEDSLLRTVPGTKAPWRPLDDSGADPLSRSVFGSQYHATTGSPELWHAVHVGDLDAVKSLTTAGSCTAKMRDGSEHSVLWHAIAFNHIGIANLMLDAFPPGTSGGIDVSEIHPRKGDTLLHLLCQTKSFSADVASIFKRIAVAMSPTLFQKVNYHGFTFMQLAAASLNFWVLTYVLKNFPVQAKALVCMPNHAPMKNLAEVVPQPSEPAFVVPDPFPEHFRVADMLQQDDGGSVPYADVAFDVGPDNEGIAACRFLAHRIVVISQSSVLFEALEKRPLTELAREKTRAAVFRVDPRISQEVWRSVLQFMYTGVINCSYGQDVEQVIELLRACILYKLPKPLYDFAQSRLYPLLPRSSPQVAFQVFAITSPSPSGGAADPDARPAREASAYLLLRSAHRLFDGFEADEAAPILGRAVQTAEHAVFNPAAPPPAAAETGATNLPPTAGAAASPMGSGGASAFQQRPHPLDQSLNMSRRGLGFVPQDMLSQSYGGLGQAPGAQSYGRVSFAPPARGAQLTA